LVIAPFSSAVPRNISLKSYGCIYWRNRFLNVIDFSSLLLEFSNLLNGSPRHRLCNGIIQFGDRYLSMVYHTSRIGECYNAFRLLEKPIRTHGVSPYVKVVAHDSDSFIYNLKKLLFLLASRYAGKYGLQCIINSFSYKLLCTCIANIHNVVYNT